MGWTQGEGAISLEPGLAIRHLRTSWQGRPSVRFPAGGEVVWDLEGMSLLCKEAAEGDGLRKGNSRSKSMGAFQSVSQEQALSRGSDPVQVSPE